MKYEEYIELLRKRAESHLSDKDEAEALKAITKVSEELYIYLHDGGIRRLAVRSLKGILSTLPEKPTERDIDKAIHLIESVILTVISCILKEGEIITVKRDKDDQG
ncbi:unnamed protein product [marine sediment metagenome]|uniref:Uncharacterized protein n=1 Tax=marine sediment metagenome TaxID=412755 RepID=X1FYF3_9ZZZZ